MGTKLDDLTLIKGIGTNRQQWLREKLHIRTYADLAALSVDDIEAQLKADGQIVSGAKIEAWLTHARQLAAAEILPGAGRRPGREGGWKPFASFVVEFQERTGEDAEAVRRTSAHHMEADRGEIWPDIALESLSGWMTQQLGLPEPVEEMGQVEEAMAIPEGVGEVIEAVQTAARPVTPTPEVEPSYQPPFLAEEQAPVLPLRLDIIRLDIFQPPDSDQPTSVMMKSQLLSGFIYADEPFTLCAVFNLAGTSTKKPTAYSAQFYACNLDTRAVTYLGESEPAPLIEGHAPYTITLPDVTLTAGLYRLQVVAKLEGVPVMGYLEVPMFQVV